MSTLGLARLLAPPAGALPGVKGSGLDPIPPNEGPQAAASLGGQWDPGSGAHNPRYKPLTSLSPTLPPT